MWHKVFPFSVLPAPSPGSAPTESRLFLTFSTKFTVRKLNFSNSTSYKLTASWSRPPIFTPSREHLRERVNARAIAGQGRLVVYWFCSRIWRVYRIVFIFSFSRFRRVRKQFYQQVELTASHLYVVETIMLVGQRASYNKFCKTTDSLTFLIHTRIYYKSLIRDQVLQKSIKLSRLSFKLSLCLQIIHDLLFSTLSIEF